MGANTYKLNYSDLDYSVSVSDIARLEGGNWGTSVIGQPRALEALSMGVAIRAKGYNLFVAGAPGTGRRTAVSQILKDYRPKTLALTDLAYVYDFHAPLAPKALSFPAGNARPFKRAIHEFVERVKKLVGMQSESGEFKKRKQDMVSSHEKAENETLAAFETKLESDGFKIVQVESEGESTTDIYPVFKGEAIPFDQLEAKAAAKEFPQDEVAKLRERYFGHMDSMRAIFIELKRSRGELETKLDGLRRQSMEPLVQAELAELEQRFSGVEQKAWLAELGKDIVNHLYLFQEQEDSTPRRTRRPPLSRYGVNVLVDNGGLDKPPVIFEAKPGYSSLIGSIEYGNKPQAERFAYLKIRAGSILKANGGFLVLQAEDLIQEEESWIAIKRILRTGRVEIEPQPGPFGPPAAIKPEAIEVNVKVVLIGGESTYDVLYQADPDFEKLFKVCAEFDSTMPRSDDSLREYVSFVRKIVKEESLRDISPDGVAAVIEYGVRLSEYRHQLSTRFSKIADLVREADYRAGKAGRPLIDAEAVDAAERARAWMADLPEEKLADMIVAGEIILKVQGSCVGRLNGLAVHDRGYYAFGLPAVISAQVSPGESGVINIEGESGLSGEIYDKAVLIVEGFLRSRYARRFPLAVSASICFEQSYTAVEGDSASSTAVYALLSAIAGVPLRQDIAVTGSMNQMGQIQPVGGVSEKIEGFYQICKKAGFTGTQGVMVPRQNVVNLTLSPEVLRAVREGVFSIWAVSSIDEGIEVLTGLKPGTAAADGSFPADSFNAQVAQELYAMAQTIKEYLN